LHRPVHIENGAGSGIFKSAAVKYDWLSSIGTPMTATCEERLVGRG
jgi:hypothetical protein